MEIELLDDATRRAENTQPATAFNRNPDDRWEPTSIAKRKTCSSTAKLTDQAFGWACY